jgi:hypothetical protein
MITGSAFALGIADLMDVLLLLSITNGAAKSAKVLLSNMNVTVCGSPTFVGL